MLQEVEDTFIFWHDVKNDIKNISFVVLSLFKKIWISQTSENLSSEQTQILNFNIREKKKYFSKYKSLSYKGEVYHKIQKLKLKEC